MIRTPVIQEAVVAPCVKCGWIKFNPDCPECQEVQEQCWLMGVEIPRLRPVFGSVDMQALCRMLSLFAPTERVNRGEAAPQITQSGECPFSRLSVSLLKSDDSPKPSQRAAHHLMPRELSHHVPPTLENTPAELEGVCPRSVLRESLIIAGTSISQRAGGTA